MNTQIQKMLSYIVLVLLFGNLVPVTTQAAESEIIYPLKQMSKLECRFEEFGTLDSDCKQDFLVLNTGDYQKYATAGGGYNDFTRIYTVLWGSSYKYGWDVGSGGHQGTDIATAKGTPVYNIADGIVIEAGKDLAWGNYISIEHTIRGKKVVSNYAHLSKILIKKGDSLRVGEKIGEVGSTGNSTGNHLHFQIDLETPFHPYYYDYGDCPYSYYQITEKGVCFNVLAKNTLDPLAFLESNGAILDKISTTVSKNTNKNKTPTSSDTFKNNTNYIFNVTVYYEYGNEGDVREVQRVMKELGYYDGDINGQYKDVESSIIKYQLETNVISSRSDDGAGWFGPKTRAQAKLDYSSLAYQENKSDASDNDTVVENNTSEVVTQTISREKLLTREEIEAREVKEFLESFQLNFISPISQISQNENKVTTLEILDRRGKAFKGNTPGNISFEYDETKVQVFPKSFYNFTNGTRDITITGLSAGHTSIDIKVGERVVKTLSVSVTGAGQLPEVKSAKLYIKDQVVLGESTPGIVLMKDQYGNNMLKADYKGNFTINSDTSGDIQYCIKRGEIKDIFQIYKRRCYDEEFTDSLKFSYSDTIGGLLLFEYRSLSQTKSQLSVKNLNATLAFSDIKVNTPIGLAQSHPYYDSVITMIESGIATGLNKGYFLEDRDLKEYDAVMWIRNSIKNNSTLRPLLKDLAAEPASNTTTINREEFLELTHKYLGTNIISSTGKQYRDLEAVTQSKVANLLGAQYQWKDQFGENYFQPDKTLSRGEASYFLQAALSAQGQLTVARN
ncbi:peptidoglycan DD-metalloendopeptidase family protein [Candidatus Gracilibacteria bacterium]|nr:peptidoglycan DD-metalloendopeptidase family protein [Candidatus Gracilibacteria bacterium]